MTDSYGTQLTRRVAARIDEMRQEQGLSLEALARKASMHRTSLGLIVRGERGLTIERAAAIAAALGVHLSTLIAEAEQIRTSWQVRE